MTFIRTKSFLFGTFMALAAIGPAIAATFEGVLTMSIETSTQQNEATGYMKGLKFRLEPKAALKTSGVEGYPIIDFGQKKLFIVSPKDKYYLTLPLSQLEASIDKVAVKIKPSGKTGSILGHQVEEWLLDDPSSSVSYSVWVTKDFSPPFNQLISLQKTEPVYGLTLGRMGKLLFQKGLFMLGASATDKSGKTLVAMKMLSVEERAVSDNEVSIPEGFKKMSDVLKAKK